MTITYKIGAGLVLALALWASAGRLSAQSGYDLFQKALATERADGNLRQAIQLYERVVNEFTGDRVLAARALMRMGECYEKLGSPDAQKVYARIAREFADQAAVAADAAGRLGRQAAAARQAGTPITRPAWTGAPDNENVGDSVSPDGRYLSRTDWFTGNLAIRDLQTSTERRLTSNQSWNGQFAESTVISPDGRQIAYGWSTGRGLYELRLIGFDGTGGRTLYSNPEVEFLEPFDWSPDQKFILTVLIRRDRTNQLVLVSADNGSVRVLKTLDWRAPWKMAFSPDGRYIVYDLPPDEDAPERDLYLLAVDGSREVPLVRHPAHDFLLGWYPRSNRVLFASTRTGANGAWSIRVSNGRPDGEPQLVKPALGQVLPMNFTRSGDYFYSLATSVRQSFVGSLHPATGTLLEALTPLLGRVGEGTLAATWGPDGRRLAYLLQTALVRGGEGANTLAIRAIDTNQTQNLPLKMSYAQRLQWHPDGRSVFVGGTDLRGRGGIFRVDLAAGSVEPVLYVPAGRFVITPDGRTLLYERRADAQTEEGAIVAFDLQTRDERPIYRFSGSAGFALSPDGQRLAVKVNLRQPDGSLSRFPSIQILQASGGDARTLLTLDEPDLSTWRQMTWSPDGKRVLFTKHHQEVWQVPPDGGSAERVVGGLTMINSISIHPDGRIALSAGNAKYETWVMEGLLPAAQRSARR